MTPETMRRNAEHCMRMADETTDDTQRMRYLRAARAWSCVAQNKERLDAAMMPENQGESCIGNVA